VALCDGSVRFLADGLQMPTFFDLANRDDGHALGDF
jgi:hypothetical protein